MARLTKAELQKEKEYWTKYLLDLFETYNLVYTIATKVSNKGMSKRLKLYVPVCSNNNPALIIDITYPTSIILNKNYNIYGILTKGVGGDSGFEIVYNLSYSLYQDGYRLKQKWL